MEVNRQNYEQYILDYFEGRLSPEQVALLFLFLEQEPELKAEFDDFENIKLESPDDLLLNASEKKQLKENIIRRNFNDYAIASLENDLDAESLIHYHQVLMADERLQKEEKLFTLSKLQPDLSLQFPDKEKLKRSSPVIFLFKPLYLRYAASLLLLIGTYALYQAYRQPGIEPLSHQTAPAANVKQSPKTSASKTTKSANTKEDPLLSKAESRQTENPRGKSNIAKPLRVHTPESAEAPIENTKTISPETMLRVSPLASGFIGTEQARLTPLDIQMSYTPMAYEETDSIAAPEFPELTETLRQLAVRRINSLALQNSQHAQLKVDAPKIHFFELAARLVRKITFNAVKLNGRYNEAGKLESYQVQAGTYAMQKEISR